MVMGTSPASSEIQKRIRETISSCTNAIHIKDDILVHGTGKQHDHYLKKVIQTLKSKGITLRPDKCYLGKSEVRWFGNIYSIQGMSPDPDKCSIIKNWPAPKSTAEVKSFLQTAQFNAKFLIGAGSSPSYPELTAPLRALTKKHARFIWGQRENQAFQELKNRLCSDDVLVPYDTTRQTRLYVDSSFIGTQATVAQSYSIDGDEVWRPVNHTSRAWTAPESRYCQIERESNGILTGMYMNKMYTLGTHVEVVTDHKPLVAIYQPTANPKQLRVDRHRTKLLPFQYTVTYEPGTTTPCDYGSRHPPVKSNFLQHQIDDWCIENNTDVYVNRVIEEKVPTAITIKQLRTETANDDILNQLMESIGRKSYCNSDKKFSPYKQIYNDLWTTNNVLMKGDQIVLPQSLQIDAISLAHEGHQFADKTLQLLRQTCWFPKMRAKVNEYVSSCLPCTAALPHNPPVPLQPNMLPDRPWQKLHCDFKGPIGGKYYLHILIDQYSKYPEVDIVSSTSFRKLKPILDRIFATHGIPESLSSDNGPPYPSHDMEEYSKIMGFKLKPVSPEDPQCNGFAENFVKTVCKLLHTSVAENKDPKAQLYDFLMQYRATPHSTTKISPTEMLFNRKIQTKLPQIFSNDDSPKEADVSPSLSQKSSNIQC